MYEHELSNNVPILFALSTCPRCRRMKEFLAAQQVNAVIVDVDRLPAHEKQMQLDFLRQVNPSVSMPTLVVGDFAVLGEDYEAAREALGL